MVFDGLSNDNEITWNLKHYQSISKIKYLFFPYFFKFFNVYLKIYYEDIQNNRFSSDPNFLQIH
jgi:hypothetical protein